MPIPAIHTFQVDAFTLHRIALPTPFPVGPVNVYLIPHEGRLLLVDTGVLTDGSCAALEKAVTHLGFSISQLDEIHLTHHHVDHCGATQWLCARSQARVFGHPDIPAYMAQAHRHNTRHHEYYMRLMKRLGVPDDKAEEAMVLWNQFKTYTESFTMHEAYATGQKVSLFTPYFVPGHSATDTVLFLGEHRVALVGDHLLSDVTPNPLMRRSLPGREPAKALVEYSGSLEISRGLRLARCFPGHGDVIETPDAIIDRIATRHEARNQKILKWLSTAGISPYQLCTLLFPRLNIANLYLGLSISLGHLELLEEMGRLHSMEKLGVVCYYRDTDFSEER